jgi:tRNA uridine 5-carboxymethylaminomethyl modification enzyme
MWKDPKEYDVIVIGAGHAGCEAAIAAARMGAATLLLTMNLDTVAKMSCNPAVGGIAKGHIVREIDALGGVMGQVTDETGIQFRMLNLTKGPAVWAPRAQCDRIAYQFAMKKRVEETPNLFLKQGTTESIDVDGDRVVGVTTGEGIRYSGRSVVLSAGTFMRGLMHLGEVQREGGRMGDKPAVGVSKSLIDLGFQLHRQKTGTPPRIHMRSIDFSQLEEQPGDPSIFFSYDNTKPHPLPQVSCYITYTSEKTKELIQANVHRSPMYSGQIQGIGPRYCPSIEDKVVRFADKERHQIFLEPEGIDTYEVYCNGISSSLPIDVQMAMVHTIPGLERAEVMRPAYAVEYDFVASGQLLPTLETNRIEGLFLAGQVNGTSGYEEAAGQGLIAGINAALKVQKRQPLILRRSEAYIGVMVDDLVAKGIDEPYRMFTSRAEYRLLLRQDNADLRLRKYGYELGLIGEEQLARLRTKEQALEEERERLSRSFIQQGSHGFSLAQLLSRPELTYADLLRDYPDQVRDYGHEINFQIEIDAKLAGYIKRQTAEIRRLDQIEGVRISADFDYTSVKSLRTEAKEKLSRVRPANLGQAARIPGISPADISILMIALER